jgi:Ring finger domain
MSTSAITSPNVGGASSGSETRFSALVIGAVMMATIIALLVLRFIVNVLIDLCILCDLDLVRRRCSEAFRKICPCWHPRTQPTDSDRASAESTSPTIELQMAASDRCDEIVSQCMKELLPCQILSETDLNSVQPLQTLLNDDHTEAHNSTNEVPTCSICLQELIVGQSVYQVTKCSHWFHRDCIQQWVIQKRGPWGFSGNNHCPNCRTEIVSQSTLDNILIRIRRNELIHPSSVVARTATHISF